MPSLCHFEPRRDTSLGREPSLREGSACSLRVLSSLLHDKPAVSSSPDSRLLVQLWLTGACRRLIIADEQREVQREISLPSGDVVGLCWAGDSLIGRRSGSSDAVVRWPDGSSEAAVLPDSDVDSAFTCLAASPDGGLVAAGCGHGQVRAVD